MAARKFKMIQVACISGLLFVSVGQHYYRAFIFMFAGQVGLKTGIKHQLFI